MRRIGRRGAAARLVLPFLPLGGAPGSPGEVDHEALLRRADVGRATPASFRARLWLRVPERPDGGRIEVWRAGEANTLVRFLDPGERGKYLLYAGKELLFLSPGARKPVRLPPSFRLRGSATLDDVLGRPYSRDYRVASVEEGELEGRKVARFHLEPREPGSPYAEVLYIVRVDTVRPERAEFRLRTGRLATVLEFVEWAPGDRLRPLRLVVKDAIRGGAATDVEVLEFEERSVPPGLFDPKDPSERKRLESASPPGN